MASIQTKNTNILGISCLVLVLLALGFQPIQAAALPRCPTGKTSWPELVGVSGCEAAARIKKDSSVFRPIVIGEGTAVPYNYDCTRVFVVIKGHLGLVSSTPHAA